MGSTMESLNKSCEENLALQTTEETTAGSAATTRNQSTKSSTDASISVSELPGPAPEQYEQEGQDLVYFHQFAKLPVELRLKIWRETFPPGRHVNLETGYGVDGAFVESVFDLVGRDHEAFQFPDRFARKYIQLIQRPMPIALSVNHESRKEALSQYVVLFQSDVPEIKAGRAKVQDRPFCFAPARDSLIIAPHYLYNSWMNKWLAYIDQELPGGLASIRSLQVVEQSFAQYVSDLSTLWGGRQGAEKGGLEWFLNLRRLQISTEILTPDTKYTVLELRIKKWYEAQGSKLHIPTIVVDRNFGCTQRSFGLWNGRKPRDPGMASD
ncbi:uncharacterized protein LY89DRAFT_717455 [Mollisia scopiformis]|uniref:2EXR domain-containing protein n=1 Tax=Mollisia scopiformis TaxID=149040 RepID=A0A194XFL4_MOLSC|nr:uncharacterized protein LY89DRAFT_717455 [Mollisia scopiformis]KUJ18958.1 hypothetical protein LY89DRAFT_717455 [Mollisia scopiformis]